MRVPRLPFATFLSAILLMPAAVPAQQTADGVRAVPTYESVGLYWADPGAGNAGCTVRFRRAGDADWRQGLDLWFDARNHECRGSLVYLTPDTEYEAQLGLPDAQPTRAIRFRTWPNQWPVARKVAVEGGSGTLEIKEGGTAQGYVVYEGGNGVVLDAQDKVPFNVAINASHVIVRGLTLRGAQQDAIRISPDVTDVVIEDNDISGWGRQRSGSLGIEQDSGIHAECKTPTLQRVTIQRNVIHDPRYGANSWSDGHPQGPQGVTLYNCGGNHVIRFNEVSSKPGHYYDDIIGGGANDEGLGFPNADSDIYGNKLSDGWDDAIEAEGANTNVRIWGNYINQSGTGIATTPNTNGPVYMFRNVYNRSRMLEKKPLDQDDRQVMFKAGADPSRGDGRRYIFHNTMLQARDPADQYGLGASGGISGTGTSTPTNETVSRNNIFHNWRTWTAYYDAKSGDDFGWDLFNGPAGAPATKSIEATPTYAPGHGWQSEANGNYQLAAGTPGYDEGVRIPNFNDDFKGKAPDVGAAEGGMPPMKFGLAAAAAGPQHVATASASPVAQPPQSAPLVSGAETAQSPEPARQAAAAQTPPAPEAAASVSAAQAPQAPEAAPSASAAQPAPQPAETAPAATGPQAPQAPEQASPLTALETAQALKPAAPAGAGQTPPAPKAPESGLPLTAAELRLLLNLLIP